MCEVRMNRFYIYERDPSGQPVLVTNVVVQKCHRPHVMKPTCEKANGQSGGGLLWLALLHCVRSHTSALSAPGAAEAVVCALASFANVRRRGKAIKLSAS